eukprot:3558653-Amphidinium_carterae.4
MGRRRSPQSGKDVEMVAAAGKSTSLGTVSQLWGGVDSRPLLAYQVNNRSGLANAIVHSKIESGERVVYYSASRLKLLEEGGGVDVVEDGSGQARGCEEEAIGKGGEGERGGRVQEKIRDGNQCDREVEGEKDGRDVIALFETLCCVNGAMVVGLWMWQTIPGVLKPALNGVGEVWWQLG